MKWQIYDADTCSLLEEVEVTEPPQLYERFMVGNEPRMIVKARPEGDAARGTVFFKVWVR